MRRELASRDKSATNVSRGKITQNHNQNKQSRQVTEQCGGSQLMMSTTVSGSSTNVTGKSKSKSKLKRTPMSSSSRNKLLLVTSTSRNKLVKGDKSVGKSRKLLQHCKG